VIVSVGSSVCNGAPSAPTLAPANVTSNIVSLSWTPGATGCPPTSYALVAGTAPGLANAAVMASAVRSTT
jgi:hypothetical protein